MFKHIESNLPYHKDFNRTKLKDIERDFRTLQREVRSKTAKTAANDFVIVDVDEGSFRGMVAMPASWLKGKPSNFDLVAEGISASEAKGWTSFIFFLAPGSLRSALKDMDSLHATANDVYTLVDEGYVDGRKAILAFR